MFKGMHQIKFEKWNQLNLVARAAFTCGYCATDVASKEGYYATPDGRQAYDIATATIRICPNCNCPSVFSANGQRFPPASPGATIENVPDDLYELYNEARRSTGASAFTAAVLACRKLLMHIAVQEGAKEGKSFASYVEHLAGKGFVPPYGKVWVDYIRTRGNEANHEIQLMKEEDAIALITFSEMLLRFIYEFPNKVPGPGGQVATT